jgi:hypothetical protein
LAARRTKIDLVELEKLCTLSCTDEEIAAWFGTSTRTIERRRLEPKFAEIMARGKAMGRISVRRMQMKLLEQGNATMGIWLGKQLLGQRDQVANEVRLPLPPQKTARELWAELEAYIKEFPELADELKALDAEFSVLKSQPPVRPPALLGDSE